MPNTVKEICASAFSKLSNDANNTYPGIKQIEFSRNLEKIGDRAFENQEFIGITIPSSCSYIGKYAFIHCKYLASVILEEGVTTLDDGAFQLMDKLEHIKVPESVTKFGNTVFTGNVVLHGKSGFEAEKYAQKCNLKFSTDEIKNIDANMVWIPEIVYNAKTQYPDVKIFVGGSVLTKDKDYTLQYDTDLVNSGIHTVKIKFKGNYSGEIEKKYNVQKSPHLLKIDFETCHAGEKIVPKVIQNPFNLDLSFYYRKSGSSDGYSSYFTPEEAGEYDVRVYWSSNKNITTSCYDTTVKVLAKLPFKDVSVNDWYYNAVKYTYFNKIISGYNSTTFAPNDKVTSGMIVTILYRMEGSPNNDGKSRFTDVNSSEWYAKAVKWAVNNGIVHGYDGTNRFGPNDNIIRQDLAGILRNYAKYKKKNVNVTANLTKFKDYKKVDSYANASVQWAVGKGVITGNTDGTLAPKGNATRAEAAAMIQKYCNKVGR